MAGRLGLPYAVLARPFSLRAMAHCCGTCAAEGDFEAIEQAAIQNKTATCAYGDRTPACPAATFSFSSPIVRLRPAASPPQHPA